MSQDANTDELYWDLLESLQDGVLREIRTYLEAFNVCEREKKSLGEIHKAVSEIYDEYVERGRNTGQVSQTKVYLSGALGRF